MSALKLESLRIQNFRTFRDLTIDRLGRVNLIVGKNNVGKTSLLEAVHFYAGGGTRGGLSSLASSRELDLLDTYRSTHQSEFGIELPAERHLFYGRPDLREVSPDDEEIEGVPEIVITSTPDRNDSLRAELQFADRRRVETNVVAGEVGGVSARVLGNKTLSVFLSAREIRAEAEKYWDQIALTDDEKRIVHALQIVEGEVEDVALARTNATNGQSQQKTRFPMARLKGTGRPEPLGNLGEGMNRMFALAIGLVRSADGILLVDEIENGLHYSVQPDLWRMIFETAQELNVQVFATTHSYDCVQAFEQVAQEYARSESMLVSLRRREKNPEDIVAVLSDRDELGAVVEENVEVR